MISLVSSDFSFAERVVVDVWIWLWFIHRVWSTDRFASLQWHKIRNFDLKSIITLLIFLMLPVEAVFDIAWTYIKYHEGYTIDYKKLYTKPTYSDHGELLWLREDEVLKTITEFMLAFCFAFQIGTLALMQAFWSHLSSQMGGKPFMRSWKFKFYVSWVFASMVIFPLARILVNKNKIFVETVPQTIFSTQMFVIFLLGIKNGRKLNNLLNSIQHTRSPSGHETILRIRYFIDMNECLMIGALFISGGILIIILSVAVTKHSITSKVFLDILIIHVNLGGLILWVTMILIIYPRYYITGTSGAVLNSTRTSPPTPQTPNFHNASIGPRNSLTNRYVINLNTTTTTTVTQNQSSIPSKRKESLYSVEESINNLLEEQDQQIRNFKHKTSPSISSTITTVTTGSNNASIFPLIPPPPLSPPYASKKTFS